MSVVMCMGVMMVVVMVVVMVMMVVIGHGLGHGKGFRNGFGNGMAMLVRWRRLAGRGGQDDAKAGRGKGPPQDPLDLQAVPFDRQAPQALAEAVQIGAQIVQGPEDHVAAATGKGVEI